MGEAKILLFAQLNYSRTQIHIRHIDLKEIRKII